MSDIRKRSEVWRAATKSSAMLQRLRWGHALGTVVEVRTPACLSRGGTQRGTHQDVEQNKPAVSTPSKPGSPVPSQRPEITIARRDMPEDVFGDTPGATHPEIEDPALSTMAPTPVLRAVNSGSGLKKLTPVARDLLHSTSAANTPVARMPVGGRTPVASLVSRAVSSHTLQDAVQMHTNRIKTKVANKEPAPVTVGKQMVRARRRSSVQLMNEHVRMATAAHAQESAFSPPPEPVSQDPDAEFAAAGYRKHPAYGLHMPGSRIMFGSLVALQSVTGGFLTLHRCKPMNIPGSRNDIDSDDVYSGMESWVTTESPYPFTGVPNQCSIFRILNAENQKDASRVRQGCSIILEPEDTELSALGARVLIPKAKTTYDTQNGSGNVHGALNGTSTEHAQAAWKPCAVPYIRQYKGAGTWTIMQHGQQGQLHDLSHTPDAFNVSRKAKGSKRWAGKRAWTDTALSSDDISHMSLVSFHQDWGHLTEVGASGHKPMPIRAAQPNPVNNDVAAASTIVVCHEPKINRADDPDDRFSDPDVAHAVVTTQTVGVVHASTAVRSKLNIGRSSLFASTTLADAAQPHDMSGHAARIARAQALQRQPIGKKNPNVTVESDTDDSEPEPSSESELPPDDNPFLRATGKETIFQQPRVTAKGIWRIHLCSSAGSEFDAAALGVGHDTQFTRLMNTAALQLEAVFDANEAHASLTHTIRNMAATVKGKANNIPSAGPRIMARCQSAPTSLIGQRPGTATSTGSPGTGRSSARSSARKSTARSQRKMVLPTTHAGYPVGSNSPRIASVSDADVYMPRTKMKLALARAEAESLQANARVPSQVWDYMARKATVLQVWTNVTALQSAVRTVQRAWRRFRAQKWQRNLLQEDLRVMSQLRKEEHEHHLNAATHMARLLQAGAKDSGVQIAPLSEQHDSDEEEEYHVKEAESESHQVARKAMQPRLARTISAPSGQLAASAPTLRVKPNVLHYDDFMECGPSQQFLLLHRHNPEVFKDIGPEGSMLRHLLSNGDLDHFDAKFIVNAPPTPASIRPRSSSRSVPILSPAASVASVFR